VVFKHIYILCLCCFHYLYIGEKCMTKTDREYIYDLFSL
jgi:hypothetical protein